MNWCLNVSYDLSRISGGILFHTTPPLYNKLLYASSHCFILILNVQYKNISKHGWEIQQKYLQEKYLPHIFPHISLQLKKTLRKNTPTQNPVDISPENWKNPTFKFTYPKPRRYFPRKLKKSLRVTSPT